MSQKKPNNQNITVGVRIRPLNKIEKDINAKACFQAVINEGDERIQQVAPDGKIELENTFEHVFNQDETNKTIFDKIVPKLIDDSVMIGFNSVLFMYGQTSSGKTYTLFGADGSPGLVGYAMDHVHQKIMASTDTEYVVRFSYAELYKDDIKDLFGTTDKNDFKVVMDQQMGSMIQGIHEIPFQNAKQVIEKIKEAEPRRTFSATDMNANSSRSHAVIRLTVESRPAIPGQKFVPMREKWAVGEKCKTVASLSLVDLAGSENTAKSNTQGNARSEGNSINQSLLALTNVITDLTEGKKFVNYRDHNLTRLLESALGGNAKTILITCLSPADSNKMETVSTLKFASKAKRVVNAAKQNLSSGDAKTMEADLKRKSAEIERLQSLLQNSVDMGFNPDESGTQREALKSSAIHASKNLLNLRFLIANAPKLIKSLKSIKPSQDGEGDGPNAGQLAVIAKKIQHDLNDAMSGGRDMLDIISEHQGYINTYLPHDSELLKKMETVQALNDADAMVEDAEDLFKDEDTGRDEGVEGQSNSGGGGGGMFDFGECDELHAQLDVVKSELSEARDNIDELEKQCTENKATEKANRKEISELTSRVQALEETVQAKTQNEARLSGVIEELRETALGDRSTQNDHAAKLTERINELTIELDDQKEQTQRQVRETMSREGEIELLKTQCEAKERDLLSAAASRKQYEEETTKARNEMRTQMERIRGNMHDMLRQGGEESKVIETQNADLQRDLDTARDNYVSLGHVKDRLEKETSHLRMEIALLRDQLKSREEQITVNVEEVSDLSQKLRDVRSEMTRTSAALTVTEQHNERLTYELQQMRATCDVQQTDNQYQVDVLQRRLEEITREMESKVEALERALQASEEQIANRQALVGKLEYSFAADNTRFERKLAQQLKAIETLQAEKTAAAASFQSEREDHMTAMRELNKENMKLISRLDAIDKYLNREEQRIAGNRAADEAAAAALAEEEWNANASSEVDYTSSRGAEGDLKSPMSRLFQNEQSASPPTIKTSSRVSFLSSSSPFRRVSSVTSTSTSAAQKYPYYEKMMASRNGGGGVEEKAVDYSQHTAQSSELFRALLRDMTTVTCTLEASCKQSKGMHAFMLSQHQTAVRAVDVKQAALQDCADRERHMMSRLAITEDNLQYARNSENRLQEQKAIIEENFSTVKQQYRAAQMAEASSKVRADTIQQESLNLKSHMEKLKSDERMHKLDVMDMQRAHAATTTRLNETLHAYDRSQLDLGLLQQQFTLMQTERDELMKRFTAMHSRSAAAPQVSPTRSRVVQPTATMTRMLERSALSTTGLAASLMSKSKTLSPESKGEAVSPPAKPQQQPQQDYYATSMKARLEAASQKIESRYSSTAPAEPLSRFRQYALSSPVKISATAIQTPRMAAGSPLRQSALLSSRGAPPPPPPPRRLLTVRDLDDM